MKYEGLLWVVEALDILPWLGVVSTPEQCKHVFPTVTGYWIHNDYVAKTKIPVNSAPVHMLHHVQVGGDALESLWLVLVGHLVHEVDIPEVPASSGLVLHLQFGFSTRITKGSRESPAYR